jgi:hypothetical protein
MLWILNLASWLSAADATVLQVPRLVRALGCSCPSALARVAFCLSMVILMLKDEREKTKYYGILSSF